MELTEIYQPGAGLFQTIGLSKGYSSRWSMGTYPSAGMSPRALARGWVAAPSPLDSSPQLGWQQNHRKPTEGLIYSRRVAMQKESWKFRPSSAQVN